VATSTKTPSRETLQHGLVPLPSNPAYCPCVRVPLQAAQAPCVAAVVNTGREFPTDNGDPSVEALFGGRYYGKHLEGASLIRDVLALGGSAWAQASRARRPPSHQRPRWPVARPDGGCSTGATGRSPTRPWLPGCRPSSSEPLATSGSTVGPAWPGATSGYCSGPRWKPERRQNPDPDARKRQIWVPGNGRPRSEEAARDG